MHRSHTTVIIIVAVARQSQWRVKKSLPATFRALVGNILYRERGQLSPDVNERYDTLKLCWKIADFAAHMSLPAILHVSVGGVYT